LAPPLCSERFKVMACSGSKKTNGLYLNNPSSRSFLFFLFIYFLITVIKIIVSMIKIFQKRF
jgi:hypothetical protein